MGQRLKAHQTREAVEEGRITLEDFQGNLEADEVANLGAAAHALHEPTAEYLCWEIVAQRYATSGFWLDRSFESVQKLGLVSNSHHLPRKRSYWMARLCRPRTTLRRLMWSMMWKDHTSESSPTTLSPDVLIPSGSK
eukprot:4184279-Amphidinium_carterae.1